jgi:hypothetical protein
MPTGDADLFLPGDWSRAEISTNATASMLSKAQITVEESCLTSTRGWPFQFHELKDIDPRLFMGDPGRNKPQCILTVTPYLYGILLWPWRHPRDTREFTVLRCDPKHMPPGVSHHCGCQVS